MSGTRPKFIQAMQAPGIYPHPVGAVTLKETHISWVFLTGSHAYKIKKPVNLGFLDFSTLEKREHYCRREVELNRRLTCGVYLDVVPITADADGFQLDGSGPVVEYTVKMKQLSSRDSLEQRLPGNTIDTSSIDLLAGILSRFYEEAATGPEVDAFGSRETVEKNCDENFRRTEDAAGHIIDRRRLRIVEAAVKGFLENHREVFENRIRNHRIRECHGDLRCDHIYLTAQGVQIIDCIEFNKSFRCSDTAADLAFLAMELDFHGYPHIAGTLVAAVVRHSGDHRLYSLLDFYKCYRAMVRLKVNYLRLNQESVASGTREKLLNGMNRYMALAYRYAVQFSRPVLWVACGPPAAGKSTVAAALADSLNIGVLRSDVVRKALFETSSFKSGVVPFGEGIYSREATSLTYGRLLRRAQEEIGKGRSMILDATFSRRTHRREALRLAGDTGAAVVFIECFCREAIIRQRLLAREAGESVSDARIRHLDELMAAFEPLDELSEACRVRVDTEKPLEENLRTILDHTAHVDACPPLEQVD